MLHFKNLFLLLAIFDIRKLSNNYTELRRYQKAILVPFVVLLSFFTATSQGFDPAQQTSPEITPPSPSAYELGKYGQIPVGKFSGTALYDVPLHNYQTRNLSIPISLSYNSNGIKVDQMPTSVGLGWSLNAGGVITRIIRDLPDELGNLQIPVDEIEENGIHNDAASDYFFAASHESADSEADIFMYNFQGKSGQFVINEDNDVVLIPHNDLDITTYTKAGGLCFKVISSDGVTYLFEDTETSMSRMEGPGLQGNDAPPTVNGTTAWHLTQVSHPYGDVVNFNYSGIGYNYITGASQSIKVNGSLFTDRCNNGQPSDLDLGIQPERFHKLTLNERRLTSISSNINKEGSITFGYSPGNKLLEEIFIKDKNTSNLKSIQLTYETTANDRVFLNDAIFKNKNLIEDHRYTFEYEDPNGLTNRLSKSQDHWGYYNGKNNSHYFPDPATLPNLYFQSGNYGGANKEPDHTYAKKGMLKKIIYPTGGYTSIDYEGNSYNVIQEVSPPQQMQFETINVQTDGNTGGTNSESFTFTVHQNQKRPISGHIRFHPDCDDNLNTGFHNKGTVLVENITDPSQTNIIDQDPPHPFADPYTNGFIVEEDLSLPSLVMDLKAGNTYKVTLSVGHICLDAVCLFSYDAAVPPTVPEYESVSKLLGGLRVKRTVDHDLNGTSNTTRYYYGTKEDPEFSTGKKGPDPYYISSYIQRTKCPPPPDFPLNCIYVENEYKILGSSSVRSLYQSINNQNITYEYVTESIGGDNFESGGIEHKYIIHADYPARGVWGNDIHAAPWTNLGWSNGLETKTIYFSKNNNTIKKIKEIDHSYTEDDRNYRELNNYVIKLKQSNANCTLTGPDMEYDYVRQNLDIMEYKIRSYWFYKNQETTKMYDENGQNPVSITTNYFYEKPGHIQLTKQRTANSDGKIYETRYKYYDEIGNASIKNWLQNNNINESWHTITYVYDSATDATGIPIDGSRFYYDAFGTSGNNLTYYPKTFQRYERTWNANGTIQTGSWQNQHVINSYNTTVGKPTKITVDGWTDGTTYTWTTTGNLNTKTYKAFVTDYDYHPTTDLLSSITEPDGQITTFVYDNFMRLDELKSRGGKIKKEYNYSYQPNYIEEISTFNDVGTANDITHTTKTTFDGLGRDIQIDQVGHKWNTPGTNISVLKEYNSRGLLHKVYEPDDDTNITASDKYTEYTYFAEPLGRVQSVKDPMGFETLSGYGANAAEIDGFTARTLMRETITDADGISTSSYTDKLGRVVATRTFKGTEESITYTNYDDKSRISTVIPPGALLGDANLIYKYTYDGADNVLSTKLPDKGLTEYKYDARNLQTAMRDANIKVKSKGWLNTQYDAYGRLHKKGFGASAGTVTDLLIHNYYDNNDVINTVNAATPVYKGKLHKSRVNILNGFNKSNSFLTTTYALDSYGRVSTESLTSNHIGLAESKVHTFDMADNKLSTKHTVGTGASKNETIESFEYDSKGRLKNNYFKLNTTAQRTIANYASYSLKDEVLSKNMGRNLNNNGYLQTVDYAYNHNGWLSKINGGSVTGTKNNCSTINPVASGDLFALDIRYNNAALAGHVDRKNGNISEIYWQVKERAKNAYRFKYDYLNRLTEAKHYSKNPDLAGNSLTHFGYYDTNYSYDERGNIMSLSRKGLTGNGNSCNAKQIDNLIYMYETGTNKLAKVFDSECGGAGLHVNPITNPNYNESYITSDTKTNVNGGNTYNNPVEFKAGNFITLEPGFSYNVNGNSKFSAVMGPCVTNSDLTNNGFKGSESSFQYDGNGNLIKDSQKQLTILYNHLNLPYKAEKNGSNKIEWKYTADGRKLQKKVTESGTAKTKNYLGNMEFAGNNTLEAVFHSEGRILLSTGYWEYNLKDHLGNVRLVFIENGSSGNAYIMQENHYYPFGMQLNGSWAKNQTVKNDYLYNGKEMNTEIGLNWIDYGARFYDPAIAKWTSVDPMSEKYPAWSPYNYTLNNPIVYNDPNGEEPITGGFTGAAIGGLTEYLGIIGQKMFDGMSFQEANASLGKDDYIDMGVAMAFGAASGLIDNGIGHLVSWVSKPRNRKILELTFQVLGDALETGIKESLKGTKYEDLDVFSIFASSLTEVGLGELLNPDIVKRRVKQTKNNSEVASKRVKDLKSRKNPNSKLIKNAEKIASKRSKDDLTNTIMNVTTESGAKAAANKVQEETSSEDK